MTLVHYIYENEIWTTRNNLRTMNKFKLSYYYLILHFTKNKISTNYLNFKNMYKFQLITKYYLLLKQT